MAVYQPPGERIGAALKRASYGLVVLLVAAAILVRGSSGGALACGAGATYLLIVLATGFSRGEMEWIAKFYTEPFRLATEPVRFGLAAAWNAGLFIVVVVCGAGFMGMLGK